MFWKECEALQDELVAMRRELHQIPELGKDLPKTRAYVTAKLDAMGIPYETACELWKKSLMQYLGTEDPDRIKEVEEKAVDWSAIIGVVAGAVVANLVHWGFASINGMVVAALCWCAGQVIAKRK